MLDKSSNRVICVEKTISKYLSGYPETFLRFLAKTKTEDINSGCENLGAKLFIEITGF